MTDSLSSSFAAAMERLAPFEPAPRLAVAVSGGADSTALALLAKAWTAARGGTLLALAVDHGLRRESASEANAILALLGARGIPGRKLTVAGLTRGPALAARARAARYGVLLTACVEEGVPHLLLGHHRSDQVETAAMRVLAGSGGRGLAAMPGVAETRFARLLRPLSRVPPGDLRTFLTAQGVGWIEDPSNRDPAAQRARIRMGLGDSDGNADGTSAVAAAVRVAGEARARRDGAIAACLAARASIRPEGYAVLSPGPIDPEALAALLRTIGGAAYAPPIERVAALARALAPATLGGVRILAAGRLGPGWLLAREPRSMAPRVGGGLNNASWDGRFRLVGHPGGAGAGQAMLGALGDAAARFNDRRGPPAAVLRTLPAIWIGPDLTAVPHLGFGDPAWRLVFDPRHPAAGAPFAVG